jgi:serine/threonine protein kinase
MKQLLKGYNELYKLEIVHRDLKLFNIFVKNGKIKIADFGFASTAQACEKRSEFNVGSPTYMAP